MPHALPALQGPGPGGDGTVSGHHRHARTGAPYVFEATFRVLGTMIDWQARVQESGSPGGAPLAGSIRLSRGQTHSVAPTLVSHMVAQAIDRIGSETAAA